jgi:hypothetical protein
MRNLHRRVGNQQTPVYDSIAGESPSLEMDEPKTKKSYL